MTTFLTLGLVPHVDCRAFGNTDSDVTSKAPIGLGSLPLDGPTALSDGV